jgi:predicted ATPase
VTEKITASLVFGDNAYGFDLLPTVDESFIINEYGFYRGIQSYTKRAISESKLNEDKDKPGVLGPTSVSYYIYHAINEWVVYHFHDTGRHSPLKRSEITSHHRRLDEDGKNIAPVLLRIKNEYQDTYEEIKRIVTHIAPFFDDFTLVPEKTSEGEIVRLRWKQKGSDYPFQVYHFSDGTLRFIALITALLQPNSPTTIIIDEPELGLHPQAISLLAEVIKSISTQKQLIISTQSTNLVGEFEPEDIITVNRIDGTSVFNRLKRKELAHWLEDYSIDELWQKNIIVGGPSNE